MNAHYTVIIFICNLKYSKEQFEVKTVKFINFQYISNAYSIDINNTGK